VDEKGELEGSAMAAAKKALEVDDAAQMDECRGEAHQGSHKLAE